MSQIGVVIPEIQPNKLKAAKSLKSSFRRHFEATTAPTFFEKLKSTVGLSLLGDLQSFHTSFFIVNREKKFNLLCGIQKLF